MFLWSNLPMASQHSLGKKPASSWLPTRPPAFSSTAILSSVLGAQWQWPFCREPNMLSPEGFCFVFLLLSFCYHSIIFKVPLSARFFLKAFILYQLFFHLGKKIPLQINIGAFTLFSLLRMNSYLLSLSLIPHFPFTAQSKSSDSFP